MLRPMQRVVTTASVEPTQRIAFWTDLVCDTYVQLECDAPAGERAIDGEIVADRLATLELSRVTATAQTVRRTPARISRASEDYFLVSIQTQGQGVVSQDAMPCSRPATLRCTTAHGPTRCASTSRSSRSC
jgi:hypothetical protein